MHKIHGVACGAMGSFGENKRERVISDFRGITIVPGMGAKVSSKGFKGSKGGLGSWFSDITGINVEIDPETALKEAAKKLAEEQAGQIAKSPGAQAAAASAAKKGIAQQIGDYIVNHPVHVIGGAIAIGVAGYFLAKR